MTELETKIEAIEAEAPEFTDELSDEALDRTTVGACCGMCNWSAGKPAEAARFLLL